MRAMTLVAVLLIALGIVALVYGGITYTSPGKTLDIGPMHLTTERTNHIPLPPVIGVIALVSGIVMLAVDGKWLRQAAGR